MAEGVLVLLYLNIFLVCGVVLRHAFSRLSKLIPYTVRCCRRRRRHGVPAELCPRSGRPRRARPAYASERC